MSSDWWTASAREELSQGDVLADVPAIMPVHPVTHLRTRTISGGEKGWVNEPNVKPEDITVLARGVLGLSLVLSHDCEMDKGTGSKSVLIAPIRPIAEVPPEHRQSIESQANIARMYLPGVPGIGDGFVNLRQITVISRKHIDSVARVCSMSDASRTLLGARLVTFFVRLDLQ